MFKMASIFLFKGFNPTGVSQYPNQSVSLTPHSHFRELTVNPLSLSFLQTLSSNAMRWAYVSEKPPISSI